jgi:hypothetical protein
LSTAFDVFPRSDRIPAFTELLSCASGHLSSFLREVHVTASPRVSVQLHQMKPDRVLPADLSSPAKWNMDQYAWFIVPPVTGGTDAYFQRAESYWSEEDVAINPRRAEVADSCRRYGYRWSFRRSASQPATVNLAYGLIAASLAELTDGLIDSRDGAWDTARLPATAEEFFTWYMRPELALEPNHAHWAARCIAGLRTDFGM